MAAERKISTRIEIKGDAEYRRRMRGINQEMKSFSGWAGVMAGSLAASALQRGLSALVSGVKKAFDASVEFETALVGVGKTTTMSDVQLEDFGRRMQVLSTQIPVTTNELLGLAEAAGQLGVADKDIEEFVKVIAALDVATNLSAESGAIALAQFANVMGTGVSEYERLGSALVELGNNVASTESDIMEMASRMTGTANMIDMSEADVLGYAAAMASVGIQAQAGGSAVSRLWQQLETLVATGDDELAAFAEASGMSAEEFARAWDTDATEAFNAFLYNLSTAGDRGESAIAILSSLGVKQSQTMRAITGMAGAYDLTTKALDLSNRGWEENIALSNEAAMYYGTKASQIAMAENALTNLAVAAGDKYAPLVVNAMQFGADAVEQLTAALTEQKSLFEIGADYDFWREGQIDEIERAALEAGLLIDRLDELGDVSTLTTAQQGEWLAVLDLIRKIMPSAAGAIDMETGAILGGTQALRETVEMSKAHALQNTELEAAKNKYDALVIAQENLETRRALYALALGKETEATAAYNALLIEQDRIYASAEAAAAAYNAETGGNLTGIDILAFDRADEWAEFSLRLGAAQTDMEVAQASASALYAEIEAGARELDEAAHYIGEYEDAIYGMAGAYEDALGGDYVSEEVQKQVDEFQKMTERVDDLQTQLFDATEAAREQVDRTVSGFSKIEMPDTVSASDTAAALQSQLDFMQTYTENLRLVQEMGLDQTLVKELSDGSAESAGILQGIVDDGGTAIDELNAKFAEVSEGKEAMAGAMAEAATDYQTKVDLIVDATTKMVEDANQSVEAESAGAKTIQGLIDGMNTKLSTLGVTVARVKALMNFTGVSSGGGGGVIHGTHAAGLAYVPADGYIAELHRGEMILTALEARAYRAEQFASYGMAAIAAGQTSIANDNRRVYAPAGDTYNVNAQIDARGQLRPRQIVDDLSAYSKRRARGRGRILQ